MQLLILSTLTFNFNDLKVKQKKKKGVIKLNSNRLIPQPNKLSLYLPHNVFKIKT